MNYEERIRRKDLLSKVITADAAAAMIKDGMVIGTSGFTPSGYPKAVPLAIAKRANEGGEKFKIDLMTGASVGVELDGALADAGVLNHRSPYHTNDSIRKGANSAAINYFDEHLSRHPQNVRYGFYGAVDFAIVEACAITEEGYLVPTTSVGAYPSMVHAAKQIIVEVNVNQPLSLEGMHDVYMPLDPPNRQPIPLLKVSDRIGKPYVEIDPSKIAGIVISDIGDKTRPLAAAGKDDEAIAGHIIDFFRQEVKAGRLPKNLFPLQSGVGSVANAVLSNLGNSEFEGLEFFSEVIQDGAFDLLDSGTFKFVSGTSLTPSPEYLQKFYANIDKYREKIILRPQEISNHPELARRLGVISMNTAIECDIYGHVNSSHIMGSRLMNGIGGSGDFTRSASISMFMTVSSAKNGDISSIVPMCSHVDHPESDVYVIVTEQGFADMRNTSPRERALKVINNCAHPKYKPMLMDYYERALAETKKGGVANSPHIISEALSWHDRFLKTGSMLPK